MFGFKSRKEREKEMDLALIHHLSEKYNSKPQTEQAAEKFIEIYKKEMKDGFCVYRQRVREEDRYQKYIFGLHTDYKRKNENCSDIYFGRIEEKHDDEDDKIWYYPHKATERVISLDNENLQRLTRIEMCAFLYAIANKAYWKLKSECEKDFNLRCGISINEIYCIDSLDFVMYGFNFEYENQNPNFKLRIAQEW